MSSSLAIIEPSADIKRKWIETRSALLWTCPAFTGVLFAMLNPNQGEMAAVFVDDDSVPVAATDGMQLILNVKGFFKYSLTKRVFIVAHEIMHNILNHCIMLEPFRRTGKVRFADGTELDYDHDQMNAAMDYVINDILITAQVGEFPETGLHDRNIATEKDNFLDTYRKIYQSQPKGGGKQPQPGNGSGGSGQKGFDTLLRPGASQGQDPATAAQQRNQKEWNTAVAAALHAAKVQGKLPANLDRLLSEVIDPQVDWREHVRAFFARRVGNSAYDWRKPDRRYIVRDIFIPARAGHGAGEVVVALDTSASIDQPQIDIFFAELRGILQDLRPDRVHVVWCDAKVHKVDVVEDPADVGGLKPKGGGGTDFRPVFQWIEDENILPDALVYMTDGEGQFPQKAPKYPVLWGSILERSEYPFGEVVQLPFKSKPKR